MIDDEVEGGIPLSRESVIDVENTYVPDMAGHDSFSSWKTPAMEAATPDEDGMSESSLLLPEEGRESAPTPHWLTHWLIRWVSRVVLIYLVVLQRGFRGSMYLVCPG